MNAIIVTGGDIDLSLLENYIAENKEDVIVYDGFTEKTKEEIESLKNELELAMTVNDLLFIQEFC